MPSDTGRDAEISAIEALIGALEPLDDAARARVLEYTLRRLGMHELPATETPTSITTVLESATEPGSSSNVIDIRTLRDQKSPATANEMAALAAFYLAEAAPENDRKET